MMMTSTADDCWVLAFIRCCVNWLTSNFRLIRSCTIVLNWGTESSRDFRHMAEMWKSRERLMECTFICNQGIGMCGEWWIFLVLLKKKKKITSLSNPWTFLSFLCVKKVGGDWWSSEICSRSAACGSGVVAVVVSSLEKQQTIHCWEVFEVPKEECHNSDPGIQGDRRDSPFSLVNHRTFSSWHCEN